MARTAGAACAVNTTRKLGEKKMTDKEKMKYYLDLLGDWGEGLASFFENECPTAPPGAVKALLEGHSDIIITLECLINDLPNE